MASSRSMEKTRKKRQRTQNNEQQSTRVAINHFQKDLLVKVVASVASNSFIDLLNLKMCSKHFLDAAEDKYVWQRVSLDTLPLFQWFPNDKTSSFLERCRKNGNVESLYREGLREYFNCPSRKIDGLEMLKVASQKGHKEAKYVCGMILLCSKDDDLRKQGLEHMRFLRKSKCVVSCRKKVKQLLGSTWKNNAMLVRNQIPICNFKSSCRGWRVKRDRWVIIDDDDDDNDDDTNFCEKCRWDHELEYFYRMVSVH